MATHSSVLAWRIPGMMEPAGLPSMGSQSRTWLKRLSSSSSRLLDRGWDGWMASPTQWTWVWASSGVGDGQGNLTCCSPWGRKESDTTKRLNWTELNWTIIYIHWWPSKNPTVAWHRWEMVGESSEISMALLVSLRHCVPYSMIYLLFASSRWFIK